MKKHDKEKKALISEDSKNKLNVEELKESVADLEDFIEVQKLQIDKLCSNMQDKENEAL